MTISFTCDRCQAKYTTHDHLQGKKARCKKCSNTIIIPTLPIAVEPLELVEVELVDDLPSAVQAAVPVASVTKAASISSPAMIQAELVPVQVVPVERVKAERVPVEVVPEKVVDRASSTTAPAASQRAAHPTKLPLENIVGAIEGEIRRVPTTFKYKAAMVGAAFVMVMLPIIYLGLIGLVALATCQYAIYYTWIMYVEVKSSRAEYLLFVAYIGPIIAGAISVLFMIKPIFAPPSKSEPTRSLTRLDEPILFAFVSRLCEAVHAPVPKRIDIDCDVNASASYRRGLLSVFSRSDLVLTIGMPLVSGLTIQQLGGVLAHEFGHFSQGFGMRLSYVIRVINHGFARAVYERDKLDEWLEQSASWLGLMIQIARFMVWLSRRILWVLMMIGNVVCSYLLRQMEFDADLHEIRFVGSEAFGKTSMQIRRLSLAYEQSMLEQQSFIRDGKLGNDMPKLTKLNRDDQTEKSLKELFKEIEQEKGNWYDTHPVDRDRIARAKEASESGVFHLNAPARILFKNYESHCVAVTHDFFEDALEDDFKVTMLVPVDQLVAYKADRKNADDALRRFFGAFFRVPRMMDFGLALEPSSKDENVLVAWMRAARNAMIEQLPTYNAMSKTFDKLDTRWLTCCQVNALQRIGVKLDPKNFEIPINSQEATARAGDEARVQLSAMHDQLRMMEQSFEQRVACALALLNRPQIASKLDGQATALAQQARTTIHCIHLIQQAYGEIARLRNDFIGFAAILEQLMDDKVNEKHFGEIGQIGGRLTHGYSSIQQRFYKLTLPFDHADGALSMSQYLVPTVPAHDELGEIYSAGDKLLEHYHYVYFRCIGTLAAIVQSVETALGLPAQPDPIDDVEPE